jgi:hypothetical protein
VVQSVKSFAEDADLAIQLPVVLLLRGVHHLSDDRHIGAVNNAPSYLPKDIPLRESAREVDERSI